jgi:LmbE family N-acetylglucosaminyl deacetylase
MDRVLAFGCHPDDVEDFAAGTLALLAEKGYEIHVAVVAGGEVGHPTMKPQEIRERRLAESAQAAAVLGGKFHYAGGHDLGDRKGGRTLFSSVAQPTGVLGARIVLTPLFLRFVRCTTVCRGLPAVDRNGSFNLSSSIADL